MVLLEASKAPKNQTTLLFHKSKYKKDSSSLKGQSTTPTTIQLQTRTGTSHPSFLQDHPLFQVTTSFPSMTDSQSTKAMKTSLEASSTLKINSRRETDTMARNSRRIRPQIEQSMSMRKNPLLCQKTITKIKEGLASESMDFHNNSFQLETTHTTIGKYQIIQERQKGFIKKRQPKQEHFILEKN